MIIEGKAVVIDKDNVDTDVLYPGTYLSIDDPEDMKPYLFEGLDPHSAISSMGRRYSSVGTSGQAPRVSMSHTR